MKPHRRFNLLAAAATLTYALIWSVSLVSASPASATKSAAPTGSPTPIPDHNDTDAPRKEEALSAWALLILTSMLLAAIVLGYVFRSRRIWLLHETIVSICMGVVVGLAIRLSPDADAVQQIVSFNHKLFFNLLLPPIIANSGYELNMKNFFRNLGAIATFAFVGTFISTLVIGLLLFLFTALFFPWLQLALLDCVIFGAILSSTDPVTVVALFQQLNVDPKLYAIIFGESILNDSVAIVLFGVLGKYQGATMGLSGAIRALATFTIVFAGSVGIGLAVAVACALLLKHVRLRAFPTTECSVVLLLAYLSYLFSNACEMSGIVSLLFCAIALKHYAYDNMSRTARQVTLAMFRILGQMSENFIFIYLGVALFTKTDAPFYFFLIVFTIAVVLVARFCSVFPLAHLINRLNARWYPDDPNALIPENHQKMMWWAGLRGAIAFALSHDVVGPGAGAIRTTTLAVCVVSVIALGGTTAVALQRLHIIHPRQFRCASAGARRPSSRSLAAASPDKPDASRSPLRPLSAPSSPDRDDDAATLSPGASFAPRPAAVDQSWDRYYSRVMGGWQKTDWNHWWLGVDNRWIRPLLTHTRWRWGEQPAPRDLAHSGGVSALAPLPSQADLPSEAVAGPLFTASEQPLTGEEVESAGSPLMLELDTFLLENTHGPSSSL